MSDALEKAILRFEARIRRVSDSLVITIPKQQATALNFEAGQMALVEMLKINEDEIKKQNQEEGFRSIYGNPYRGALYFKEVEIAKLDSVFFKEEEYQLGFLGEGQSLDSLPLARDIRGLISRGRYLSSSFLKLASKEYGYSPEEVSMALDAFSKMELERGDEKIIFEHVWFGRPNINLRETSRMDNLEFHVQVKNVKKTSAAIDGLKELLSASRGIAFAFVYGSIARGTFNKRSDLDALIIGAESNKLNEGMFELQKKTSRPINYIIWSASEFKRKVREKDSFLGELIRNKIEWLHGDRSEFERITEREMDRKKRSS